MKSKYTIKKRISCVPPCTRKFWPKNWFASLRLVPYIQDVLFGSRKFETMKSEAEQKRDKNQNKMTKESSKLEKPCKFLIVIYGMDSMIEYLWMFVAVFLLISAMDHMKSPKSAIEISSTYGLVVYLTQTCCVGWLGSIIEYKSVLVLQPSGSSQVDKC